MEEMKFEEMVPMESAFSLVKKPEKVYHLRPFNLLDGAWAEHKFGNVNERIRTNDMDFFCAVAIHLMNDDDVADFAPRKVNTINTDTGERGEAMIGGAPLLKALAHGMIDRKAITTAISETFGVSQARQKDIEAIAEAQGSKKNPTGPESSTGSPANTGGPQTRSPDSPRGSLSA